MKYKLTDESIEVYGQKLFRIECVTPFGNITIGQKGGFVASVENLSQEGNAWVYDNAWVYGNARVYGDARVYDNAEVYGNAKIKDRKGYIVFKNWWSSGRHFTWTSSNDKWKVGCFYGTGAELIAKAYKDSQESGDEYKRIVEYVESIKDKFKE